VGGSICVSVSVSVIVGFLCARANTCTDLSIMHG